MWVGEYSATEPLRKQGCVDIENEYTIRSNFRVECRTRSLPLPVLYSSTHYEVECWHVYAIYRIPSVREQFLCKADRVSIPVRIFQVSSVNPLCALCLSG